MIQMKCVHLFRGTDEMRSSIHDTRAGVSVFVVQMKCVHLFVVQMKCVHLFVVQKGTRNGKDIPNAQHRFVVLGVIMIHAIHAPEYVKRDTILITVAKY